MQPRRFNRGSVDNTDLGNRIHGQGQSNKHKGYASEISITVSMRVSAVKNCKSSEV